MSPRLDRNSPLYSASPLSPGRPANMSSSTANFIGAVEDEWQMYRSALTPRLYNFLSYSSQ